MANGDVDHTDLEAFLQIQDLPDSSPSAITSTEVDVVAADINAEVNLMLKRIGFALPITEPDSVKWLEHTKKIGLAAWYLDNSMSQDVEEGNTRADRYYERYMNRLQSLMDSNGDILDAPLATDDEGEQVNEGPIAGSEGLTTDSAVRSHLTFTQYMLNAKGENEDFITDYADDDVRRRIR